MKDFEKQEVIYEDAIAKRYNRDYHKSPIMKAHSVNFAMYVAKYYHLGDRVLDLGCGPASLWELWKKHLPEPACLIGVDLSQEMIKECKGAYPEDDFRVGSIFELPLESGSIDLIIASSIFHHIPDDHLEDAFVEIERVLDEHGKIVGREPVSIGRLGDIPGWFSGALMVFRHLVYRLTHTREFPEPPAGEHHHAYNPSDFLKKLRKFFPPKGVMFRHPVSSYISRSSHPLVAKLAILLDNFIEHRGGHELYYIAEKNYADAADVAFYIKKEIENNSTLTNKKEFLALLQKAADVIEKELHQ